MIKISHFWFSATREQLYCTGAWKLLESEVTTHCGLILRIRTYNSTPPNATMAWCLIEHRENCNCTLGHSRHTVLKVLLTTTTAVLLYCCLCGRRLFVTFSLTSIWYYDICYNHNPRESTIAAGDILESHDNNLSSCLQRAAIYFRLHKPTFNLTLAKPARVNLKGKICSRVWLSNKTWWRMGKWSYSSMQS